MKATQSEILLMRQLATIILINAFIGFGKVFIDDEGLWTANLFGNIVWTIVVIHIWETLIKEREKSFKPLHPWVYVCMEDGCDYKASGKTDNVLRIMVSTHRLKHVGSH